MSFVHLHNHTHYSLLDGLTKIDELIGKAKEQGSPAVAITDHGVMYGVIEFYQKCLKAEIKPIIGFEAYLAPKSRHAKSSRQDAKNYHLLLLAKNRQGYHNLIKLTALAHLEGYYYKPRIDWELLEEYKEGIIASTACMGGEIPKLILSDKREQAKERIKDYLQLFGEGNFYLELMDHPELKELEDINKNLIELGKELGVPLIATNDIHYLKKEDNEAQDILLCLQNKKKLEDTDRLKMIDHGDYSMRDNEEMIEAFAHVPEAIKNTLEIAEKCNVDIELGHIQLPFFEVPKDFSESSYLREICEKGLKKRFGKDLDEMKNSDSDTDKEILRRMNYELEVIDGMGWPSYFLIVADFVRWSRDHGIVVGPGRGSAAGSLVCYLTGITNLDPIKYELLFERFLNPERISMPDIDLDFADTRRDEVIEYVENKYGKDHVAQIITFGTMAAKAAIRDVGRVLGEPYEYCDKLAKMVPMFTKIDEALENTIELKEIYEKEEAAKRIIDFSRRLEGVARHTSTHACGVLITKKPLVEYAPTQYASSSDKSIVSQYSLHPVEELGLLKMDFLGLKNLTIIEACLKIIKGTHDVEIDIDTIPLDDKKAYKLFQDGSTTGVFQFESSGMKRYLRELKPTEFEDIVAMVSLYRPGPMEWIPDYIAGKHGKKRITYLHPKLEPILKSTYGVAIYQEQVMRMARDLAGFTMGEADVLRKAVGKKIITLLVKQKQKFIEGCVKNGISQELAEKIFSFIEPFAGYGFNRSHAACYALIGYQTAYLKAHWPTEFMAALLTSDLQNIDRVAIEIDECRKMGIEVLPPDVNESFGSFAVVKNKDGITNNIRFGMKAIKNVGEHIADVVIEERKNNGHYKDVFDLLERVVDRDMNKKSLESLVMCGGLDGFGERGQFLGNMEMLLSYNKEISKAKNSQQGSLFSGDLKISSSKPHLEKKPEVSQQEKLAWEKTLLGLYITEHPFSDYKEYLNEIITPLSDLTAGREASVVIAGVVTGVKKIITRSNEAMLFVKVEDTVKNIEVLVFPRLLKETGNVWVEGNVVACSGKISNKDQEVKLLADKAFLLELEAMEAGVEKVKRMANKKGVERLSPKKPMNSVNFNPLKIVFLKDMQETMLNDLRNLFMSNQGMSKVYFKINPGNGPRIIETGFRVDNNEMLVNKLREQFNDYIEVVNQ